jgi:hypothetical protein
MAASAYRSSWPSVAGLPRIRTTVSRLAYEVLPDLRQWVHWPAVGCGGSPTCRQRAKRGRGGVYASLLPRAVGEYARSGDPRWRFRHDDGEGGVCRGGRGCTHGDPPPSPAARGLLDALEAGRPVVVSAWIATGRRWLGLSWSGTRFELPWREAATRVRVTSQDRVFLAE